MKSLEIAFRKLNFCFLDAKYFHIEFKAYGISQTKISKAIATILIPTKKISKCVLKYHNLQAPFNNIQTHKQFHGHSSSTYQTLLITS